jgi:hypothetical protein
LSARNSKHFEGKNGCGASFSFSHKDASARPAQVIHPATRMTRSLRIRWPPPLSALHIKDMGPCGKLLLLYKCGHCAFPLLIFASFAASADGALLRVQKLPQLLSNYPRRILQPKDIASLFNC